MNISSETINFIQITVQIVQFLQHIKKHCNECFFYFSPMSAFLFYSSIYGINLNKLSPSRV